MLPYRKNCSSALAVIVLPLTTWGNLLNGIPNVPLFFRSQGKIGRTQAEVDEITRSVTMPASQRKALHHAMSFNFSGGRSIKSTLFKLARMPFRLLGLDLVKYGDRRNGFERLTLAHKLGFKPQRIVDGGAFRGLWSVQVARLYPDAEFVLVEPNPGLQKIIAENVREFEATVVNVALAESSRRESFNFWQDPTADEGASLLDHVSGPATTAVEVEVDSLDRICERLAFSPDLVKLDLQGGELAAIEGAQRTLQSAELAIIEFGVLDAYVGRTSPRELLDVMYDNDFVLYDIVDCMNRPYDDALCSGDFFFVKKSSPLRSYKGFM